MTTDGQRLSRLWRRPLDDRRCAELLAECAAAPRIAPTIAWAVLVVSLVGFGLLAVGEILDGAPGPLARTTGVVSVAALSLVQIWVSGPRCDRSGPRRVGVVLVGQAVLVAAPLAAGQPPWPGVPGFLAGSALLLSAPVPGIVGFGLTVVAVAALEALVPVGATVVDTLLGVAATVVVGLAVFGLTMMRRLLREATGAREQLHRAIAERERAQMARDVHDLLGSGLSAVVLRCELAMRLLPDQVDRATQELAEVVRLSRRARDQVRAAAEGLSDIDMAAECRDAERVLTSAGVRTSVRRVDAAPDSTTHAAVLVAGLREGVTNVLRHSVATWCEIEVSCDPTRSRLLVVNDGASDPPRPDDGREGQGLSNLGRRAAEAGGTATSSSARGVHRLEVRVPGPRRTASEPVRLAGDPDGVQAVAGVELGHGGRQVVADRARREEEA